MTFKNYLVILWFFSLIYSDQNGIFSSDLPITFVDVRRASVELGIHFRTGQKEGMAIPLYYSSVGQFLRYGSAMVLIAISWNLIVPRKSER